MGFRVLENIDEKILRAILQRGAEVGVLKVSSKKIAADCGIATCTIFNKFGTMQAALDAAAQLFDRLHMAEVREMTELNLTTLQIWERMLDCFLADPDGTLYYISYTNTFGFDPTGNNPRAEEFLEIAKTLFRPKRELADEEYLLLWDYITSMAFYYAEKFIHYMPNDERNRARVRRIVFEGLNYFLEDSDGCGRGNADTV